MEWLFVGMLLFFGLTLGASGTLRAQTLLLVLSGTSAFQLAALGGATITVPYFFLAFLWYRAWLEGQRAPRKALVSSATLLLGLTVLWGTLLALFVPRALHGDFKVIALSRDAANISIKLVPVGPVSGNVTQSVYAIGDVLTFAAGRTLMRDPSRRYVFADAVITLGLLNSTAAVINLIEFYTGMPSLLDFVRTAYETTHQAWGGMLPRIQGTFPETSAFSVLALGLFAFNFQLWLDKYRPVRSGLAAASQLLFLLFSTSGTAYVGLSLYLAVLMVALFRRAAQRRATPRFAWALSAIPLALSVAQLLLLIDAPIVHKLGDFFDEALFHKLDSDSGQERGMWNEMAWRNFLDTWGLGLGFGTVRTSSFSVTLLSNLGVIGTILYVCFLIQLMITRSTGCEDPDPRLGFVRDASLHAVFATLAGALVSATVFDLGSGFYLFAAAASLPIQRSLATGRAGYSTVGYESDIYRTLTA